MSLIHQAAALVVVIQAWILLLHKRAVMRAAFSQLIMDRCFNEIKRGLPM
jgi:hypothetical protein